MKENIWWFCICAKSDAEHGNPFLAAWEGRQIQRTWIAFQTKKEAVVYAKDKNNHCFAYLPINIGKVLG